MAKAEVKKKRRPASDAPFAMPDWPSLPTMRRVSELKPYEHNTRTHPPAQITLLASLLKRWGPDQPIVVDEDDVILKGHGRRLAAMEAGVLDFPVVVRAGLPEDEKRAMRIADNQVGLLAGWDNELMKFEIESLTRGGYEVALLGFGEAQLVQFTTTPGPPGEFRQFGEDIETEHQCPKCGYKWSGNSAAREDEPPAKSKKRA